jgi:hypothetical protein
MFFSRAAEAATTADEADLDSDLAGAALDMGCSV